MNSERRNHKQKHAHQRHSIAGTRFWSAHIFSVSHNEQASASKTLWAAFAFCFCFVVVSISFSISDAPPGPFAAAAWKSNNVRYLGNPFLQELMKIFISRYRISHYFITQIFSLMWCNQQTCSIPESGFGNGRIRSWASWITRFGHGRFFISNTNILNITHDQSIIFSPLISIHSLFFTVFKRLRLLVSKIIVGTESSRSL